MAECTFFPSLRFLPVALGLLATPSPSEAQAAGGSRGTPGATSPPAVVPKDVAAPPEDLLSGRLRLPPASSVVARSRAALLEVRWVERAPGDFVFEEQLPLGRRGRLDVAVLSPGASSLRVTAAQVRDRRRATPTLPPTGRDEVVESPIGSWARVASWDAARAGEWTIRLESTSPSPATLLVADETPFVLATHLLDWGLTSDRGIGLVAWLEPDERPGEVARLATYAFSVRATDGVRSAEAALFDDGLHGDGDAGDGVFGGTLPPRLSGNVALSVTARAVTPEGLVFVRSAPRSLPVLERRVLFADRVESRVLDRKRLALDVAVHELHDDGGVHASVEVWGTAPSGELVPVAWLSRQAEVHPGSGDTRRVRLILDGRWLNRAGAGAPLELRGLRLQDPDTHVVLDRLERLPVPVDSLPAVVGLPAVPIDEAMLTGVSGLGPRTRWGPRKEIDDPGSLMLVHGYCSGAPPWPPSDFSEPKRVFSDLDENRSHDEFARLILEQADGLPSFGVVAHSQGGAASLHLYTYFRTGLDLAQGPRRIQSLATPYLGTPLADLGNFPGVGCGSNTDLSPSGSALWLAGIPTWARKQVWYWSTSNAGGACNVFTNLFLPGVDDGVVQQDATVLDGGNGMGHMLGWCHTTGMSEPAAYQDATRNAELDAQAAR